MCWDPMYSLYTSPLRDIARKHGIPFHLYADDTLTVILVVYIQLSESSILYKDGSITICEGHW